MGKGQVALARIPDVGERFSKLVVTDNTIVKGKYGVSKIECACDCGQVIMAKVNELLNSHRVSCGKCSKRSIIVPGTQYGEWTIIRETESGPKAKRFVLCRCSCGTERIVKYSALTGGVSLSCGCKNYKLRDIEPNELFGEWLTLGQSYTNEKDQKYILCRCTGCGVVKPVEVHSLLSGISKSCGGHKGERIQYLFDGDIVTAVCSNGKSFVFDACDFDMIRPFQWHVSDHNVGTFTRVNGKRHNLSLHRLITNEDKGFVVDHKDGDYTNNRRENLRICTQKQNTANQRLNKLNTSGFKGVSAVRNGKAWSVRAADIHLGTYATREEAALAYDKAARELFGEFACVNFPRPGERCAITNRITPLLYAVDTNGVKISYDDRQDDDFETAV